MGALLAQFIRSALGSVVKLRADWSSADGGGLGGGHARCTERTEPRLRPLLGSHALGPAPPSKSGRSSSRSLHFCCSRRAQTVPLGMSLHESCPWMRHVALMSVSIGGREARQPRPLPRANASAHETHVLPKQTRSFEVCPRSSCFPLPRANAFALRRSSLREWRETEMKTNIGHERPWSQRRRCG